MSTVIYEFDRQQYEDYCTALQNLNGIYCYEEPYDTVVQYGIVGLYKICFDQCCNAMKEIMEFQGISEGATGSPRQILKSAYQAGMIADETLWLDALNSRNNVSHAYNHVIALDIVKKTKESYYQMFCTLQENLEENWIDKNEAADISE